MHFIWDEAKDQTNQRKHGVGFSDARNVFSDPLALVRLDQHVGSETRWQILGHWGERILLLVVYTVRMQDGTELIRLISARRASPAERRRYEKGSWL